MDERGTHISWLKSCPANDGNFKAHLKQAYAGEIASLIKELPTKGNKSKIAALKSELRKRQYEVNTFKGNGEIETSQTFNDYYKALDFFNSLRNTEIVEFIEVNRVDETEVNVIKQTQK